MKMVVGLEREGFLDLRQVAEEMVWSIVGTLAIYVCLLFGMGKEGLDDLVVSIADSCFRSIRTDRVFRRRKAGVTDGEGPVGLVHGIHDIPHLVNFLEIISDVTLHFLHSLLDVSQVFHKQVSFIVNHGHIVVEGIHGDHKVLEG